MSCCAEELTRRVEALEAEAATARDVAQRDRAALERRIDGLGRGAEVAGVVRQREELRTMLAEALRQRDVARDELGGMADDESRAVSNWQRLVKATGCKDVDGACDEIARLQQRDRDADEYGDALVDLTGIRSPRQSIAELQNWPTRLKTAEQRAHDLANEAKALRCDVDELPGQCRWVERKEGHTALVKVGDPAGTPLAELRFDGEWVVFSAPDDKGRAFGVAEGCEPSSQHIARIKTVEAVREHWGPIEVVE